MNRLPPTRRLSLGVSLYKRVFPIGWLCLSGFVALWTAVQIVRQENTESPFEYVPMFFVGIVGYVITRIVGRDLADEVLDGGDHLVVRQDTTIETIPLADIEVVKQSIFRQGPPRIELVLNAPSSLGRVIAFIPKTYSLLPFVHSDITRELTQRVAIATRERRTGRP